jgi:predicted transcriptional regulator of viral defense system
MPQTATASKLAGVAEDQWGLLTRRQAEAAGISAATLQRLSADGSILERIERGVYHLAGAPLPDHMPLRAAWLQLAPTTLAWERKPEQGVISHRSAAALYGLGHLPADRHEFILAGRRQTRRPDVRIHRGRLQSGEWGVLHGLPLTSPARTAADLLADREDPEAVARVIADALRGQSEWAGNFAATLAGRAAQLGLRRGDGIAALGSLLNLTGDPQTSLWMEDARSNATEITPATLNEPAQRSG